MSSEAPINGHCVNRFHSVSEEFERNFHERGEIGASVCVIHEGETVVDLWAGVAERSSQKPWDKDTLVLVWSCTKGATALCAHLLVARGLLNLDAPVAAYWPEFGQQSKDDITVRMLLDHTAGVPAIREPLRPGGLYDWEYIIKLLEMEKPFWPAGTRQGYHAMTFGFLVGEVVRRIAGKSLGRFFAEEIAQPLGIDFFIGLPESFENRVAPIIRPDPTPKGETPSAFLSQANTVPDSLSAFVVKNHGRNLSVRDYDSRAAHEAVLPSQGGITNARGLAGMYAPLALGGAFKGVQLVDRETLIQMAAVSSASPVDAVLQIGIRFSLGFWKSSDNRHRPPGVQDSVILSEDAFGHPGMGGSLGFADPKARVAFGYAMNKQGRGVGLNNRGQSLVDAVYRSLGYNTNRPGRWV